MLKFVSSTKQDFPEKPKQAPRACDTCRRRKKKCNHHVADRLPLPQSKGLREQIDGAVLAKNRTGPSSNAPRESGPDHYAHPLSPASNHDLGIEHASVPSISDSHPSPRRHQHTPALRFEGNSSTTESLGSRYIGDLNPEGILLAATRPGNAQGTSNNESVGIWLTEKLSDGPDESHIPGTVEASSSLFDGFSALVQEAAVPILRRECLSLLAPPASVVALCKIYFDKVHPILPIVDRGRFDRLDPSSPSSILLKHGMCLVASIDFGAKRFLLTERKNLHLDHRDFGKRVLAAMRMMIELGMVRDRVVLIQAFALMSMFRDGPDGNETSSQFCARAILHLQSTGMHLNGRASDKDDHLATTLLCCVWAIDIMNAAYGGRPVLMHERDFGKQLESCFAEQSPTFQVLLRITYLLSKVIELYRPTQDATQPEWHGDFPIFEILVAQSNGWHIVTSQLTTLEVFYHAVAILSCRPKSGESNSNSPNSHVRQQLSAQRVTSLVGEGYLYQLSLLPFIPYAVSLSTSVAYLEMRHNKIPMYRSRASSALRKNCEILEVLGEVFSSASVMAGMGKSTLKEMDRVVNEVATSDQLTGQPSTVNGRVDDVANPNYHMPASISNQGGNTQPYTARPYHESHSMEPHPLDYEFSILDNMPDLDIFGLFQPSFDLDGVDACLGANLDLSVPTNFG